MIHQLSKSSAFLLLLILILGSCSTSRNSFSNSTIQKRKYTKGYHVDMRARKPQKKSTEVIHPSAEVTTLGSQVERSEEPLMASSIMSGDHGPRPASETSIIESDSRSDLTWTSTKERKTTDALIPESRIAESQAKNAGKKRALVKAVQMMKSTFVKYDQDKGPVKTHWAATTSILCGMLGLLVAALPLGLCAIVFGIIAIKAHSKNPTAYKSKGVATVGIMLGLINVILALAYLSTL